MESTYPLSAPPRARPLEPYLGEIVLCGGWVPYLYWARHPEPGREPPLQTQDADFARTRAQLPRKATDKPDPSLLERRYTEFRSVA